jgi:hypothetical protein
MRTKMKLIMLLAVLLTCLFMSVNNDADAALSAVGPVDPANGFPQFYQDPVGLGLVPCLTQNLLNPLANQFCVLLTDCVPGQNPPNCFNASQPISFPGNFPIEFFYWIADNRFDAGVGGAAKVVFRMALEGTFANLSYPILPGQQMTFLRVNLKKMSGLTPNSSYTVTYPFGSFVITTDAAGNTNGGGISATQAFRAEDGCGGAPCDFTLALPAATTHVSQFLKCTGLGFPLVDPTTGISYIGSQLAPCDITPGPNGNFIRINGPNIGGIGVNTITSPAANWFVAGEVFNGVLGTPLVVDRSTYSRTAAGLGEIDIFATSAATAAVTVSGGPNLPAAPVTMTGDPTGRFFTSIIPAPNALTLPPFVSVTATNVGSTATTVVSPLEDVVTISKAEYNPPLSTLTIEASSSDQVAPIPTLTAVGFTPGTLAPVAPGSTLQRLVVTGIVPPAYVTVDSSRGGTHTEPVVVGTTFSISGNVTLGGGPLAGVTVTLTGAAAKAATTDALGNYSFTGLGNGAYTVTPSKAGTAFTPASSGVTIAEANVTGVNFAGVQTFSISGNVTHGGLPATGVTLTLSGAAAGATTTDAAGNYTFTGLLNGIYTVTPSKAGLVFTPPSSSVTIAGANANGVNFTAAAGTAGFSISGTVTNGGVGQSGVTVTLGGAATATTTTNASGNYTFTGLAAGNYTVTPSLTGFAYTPASSNVAIIAANVTGVNFAAVVTYLISGTVKDSVGGFPSAGVTMTITGLGIPAKTTTTDAAGNYTFTGLPNGTYTVTPSQTGHRFSPTSLSVTINNSNKTGQNFTRF